MPLQPAVRAVATRDSIANLWAMAEATGSVTIRVASKRHCYLIRNKLYKHRATLRKNSHALQGIEASHLDGFKINYWEETQWEQIVGDLQSHNVPTGQWLLTISYDEMVEFELLLEEDYDMTTVPHFDTLDDLTIPHEVQPPGYDPDPSY